ncbi:MULTISPECIES: methyltransferase domain-containing protein [unclassified Nitratiruptor]|uniref:methyltransferase domain-containing protein n=1 Tax=unclassified Nitratiruptor TaxID=2624044 RepID=UPI001915519D|nr:MULTISPECIES: methyltransferase domain-containing protein [unclassified Nitratiruptor]BCD60702.1 hypothetical protein NitYY0810_C1480 [Nitratiruptor sp. YY08-10]BCD64635.1 O-antigen chain-terminating methyltransferase [Nitratiruptor sp. YY08-14]
MIDKIIQDSQKNRLNIKELLRQKDKKDFILFAYYALYNTLPPQSSLKKLKKKIFIKLLELDDEEFLEYAYLLILKREIDDAGKRYYLQKLNYHLKEQILDEISSSKEAWQKNGLTFKLNLLQKLAFKFLPVEYKVTLNKQKKQNKEQQKYIKALEQNLHQLSNLNAQTKQQLSSLQQKLNQLSTSLEFDDVFIEECEYLKHAHNECKRLFNQDCKDYYILFENIFYNSEAVKNLQKNYLPYIKSGKIVDIGCGRGEFLEILKNNNYQAIGVEINDELVKLLKKKGFHIFKQDANTFLKEHQGFDTIVALEVIEHFETDYLKEFLHLSFQTLNKKGIVILETVNPLANTGLGNFYMDITHKKPLPAKMMAFWMEYVGFKNIKILYSSLVPVEYRTTFIEKNYQTYAIIGEKI